MRGNATMILGLAYLGFVSLGLPDAMVGVVWPSIRQEFALTQSGLGVILLCAGLGYFASSALAGVLMRRWGVGVVLAASTCLVTLALLGYALAPGWAVLIAFAPLVGLGSGAVDAGLNAYAASHFSARHMNWLHAAFGLGATIGPLVVTAILTGGLSWRWAYVAIGLAMLTMTMLFLTTRAIWQNGGAAGGQHWSAVGAGVALRNRRVWLQISTFLVYTGLEMAAGQWCFALLSEGRGLSAGAAGLWTSFFWGSLVAGRVVLGLVAERVGPDRLVQQGALGALIGAVLLVVAPTPIGLVGLLLLGFSLAPIYPMLMLRTPGRLGPDLAFHAVGFQVSAALVGGIALPGLGGILADRFGLEAIPTLLVVAAVGLVALERALRAGDSRP